MRHIRETILLIALSCQLSVSGAPTSLTADGTGLFPEGVKRVLFLGDSITYSGQYVETVAAYHKARFPGREIEFINVGLSSETVSGLSEPGHAGGKFPRPDLHERLARVLDRYSEWLVSQRTNGWDVVDLHMPMRRHLEQQRASNPAYAFSRDGIHPDDFGHWLMAQTILLHLGTREAASANSASELLKRFPNGDEVLRRERQEIPTWRDAWLTATGHKRPGVKPGLPIAIDPKTGQARLLTDFPSAKP